MVQRKNNLWLIALVSAIVHGVHIEHSKPFPLGSEVENLALRPSGSIVTTVYTFPRVYEVAVEPHSTPRLLHTFQDTHGACGISESSAPDEFFILTGNFSFPSLSPTPGSYAIHRLSFDDECDEPHVEELASLPTIAQPNGMITVPGTPFVLIADCVGGFVYRFNTKTLTLSIYFDDPLLKPRPVEGATFGVNGIKLSRGYLYFSNSNLEIVARIKATGLEPKLTGKASIVATQTSVDDFIVNDFNGDIYTAEQGNINGIGFVAGDEYGSVPKTIAGGPNSTALLGPTAAQWAKGAVGRVLLVTVTGGFEQFVNGPPFTNAGDIAFVHVK